MEKFINRNAFFKELIRTQGTQWTYTKVCAAFEGKSDTLSTTERIQLLKMLDAEVNKIKENIKQSSI